MSCDSVPIDPGTEKVRGAFDALDAALDAVAALSFDGLEPLELLDIMARREVSGRRLAAVDHRILPGLVGATAAQLQGSTPVKALVARLQINRTDAKERLKAAEDLGPRRGLTGEPLPPRWDRLAAVAAAGQTSSEHVVVARKFYAKLPTQLDGETLEAVSNTVARWSKEYHPESFRWLTDRLLMSLQDEQEPPIPPADDSGRRGVRLGRQDRDGYSTISGVLSAQGRAVWEAIFAKLTTPGMANPADAEPCLAGTPTAEQIQNDSRTAGQRRHDALVAAGNAVLASGTLGQLHGLPTTVIVTATLEQLQNAAGVASTVGGTRISIPELLKMATPAYHYLSIFDGKGRALWLGRSKRLASADQRIVLYARDRGCTMPGCTISGYHTQAHHLRKDWQAGGQTDIDTVGLACPGDNRTATEEGWTTYLNTDGRVVWIPPDHLDGGQGRVNPYHHPETMLAGFDEDNCQPAPVAEIDADACNPDRRPPPEPPDFPYQPTYTGPDLLFGTYPPLDDGFESRDPEQANLAYQLALDPDLATDYSDIRYGEWEPDPNEDDEEPDWHTWDDEPEEPADPETG